MKTSRLSTVCFVLIACVACTAALIRPSLAGHLASDPPAEEDQRRALRLQYLEIVTPELDATCEALAKAHGVAFGDPILEMGNARTATLDSGGRIGVRKPMHGGESPTVRPYILVEDIQASLKAATDAGGVLMHPPMEIPGQGTFALYELGGIQHGLWEH